MKWLLLLIASFVSLATLAQEEKIQLETTRIKANKELPQVLYIVPWKDFKAPKEKRQTLKLHDLFGELYKPVLVSEMAPEGKVEAEE